MTGSPSGPRIWRADDRERTNQYPISLQTHRGCRGDGDRGSAPRRLWRGVLALPATGFDKIGQPGVAIGDCKTFPPLTAFAERVGLVPPLLSTLPVYLWVPTIWHKNPFAL